MIVIPSGEISKFEGRVNIEIVNEDLLCRKYKVEPQRTQRSQRKMERDSLTEKIIGCAIEIHRITGPGLLESAYEQCMAREMVLNGLNFQL